MSYKVKLEVFEGPLDLLLYLIKKEEVDIYDIPIAKVTEQYLEYLEVMQMLDLGIAGEFLVMAATLMHIKSRMLLPKEEAEAQIEEEEEDPRAELVARLLEYKKYKEAASRLDELQRERADVFTRPLLQEDDQTHTPLFEASIFDLISAFSKVAKDIKREDFFEVTKDEFTVEEKIHQILHLLLVEPVIYVRTLFETAKNKLEIVTLFLALLELIRLKEVIIRQRSPFGEIQVVRSQEHTKPVRTNIVVDEE